MEDKKPILTEPTADEPVSIRITKAASEDNTLYFSIIFKTILPEFTDNIHEVVRSHQDFLWLYQALKSDESTSFAHIPAPPFLPDFCYASTLTSLIQKEFIEQNVSWIEKRIEINYQALFQRALNSHEAFIIAISKKEAIRDHYAFQMFLTSGTTLASTEGALNSFVNFTRKIYKKFENKFAEATASALSLEPADEEIERTKVFLKGYTEGLQVALDLCVKVITRGQIITIDSYNVENTLKSMVSVETSNLQSLYNCFAECIGKNRSIEELYLEDQEYYLADLFRFYLDDSRECLDVIHFRTKLMSKVAAAKQNFLKSQVNGRNVIESKVLSESLEKTLNAKTETILQELKVQAEERVEKFSKNILNVCNLGIRVSTARINNLEKAINAVEADDFE